MFPSRLGHRAKTGIAVRSTIRSLPASTEGPYLRAMPCDLGNHHSDSAGDNDGGFYRSNRRLSRSGREPDHGSSSQTRMWPYSTLTEKYAPSQITVHTPAALWEWGSWTAGS